MAEKPQDPPELPAAGGSYTRDPKGKLIPAPAPEPEKED